MPNDEDGPQPIGGEAPRAAAGGLRARGLAVRLGGARVLDGIALDLPAGRVTAVVGPNGAGKTTLLRAIVGAVRPEAGGVLLDGVRTDRVRPGALARRIAYVSQQPGAAFGFRAREVVAMGRFGVGASRAAVDRAIATLGLGSIADRPIDRLSVGQRQRVALARALAQLDRKDARSGGGAHPRWLLLDEPLSALDPMHAMRVTGLVRALADDGLGVVVVLHDLTVALRAADRAAVLGPGGALLGEAPAGEALTPENLERAYGVGFRIDQTPAGPVVGSVVGASSDSGVAAGGRGAWGGD